MPAPERIDDARCPRCGEAFHCGVDDLEPCACTTITLDAATLAALTRQYESCLCVACLRALGQANGAAPPTQ
jgi:hypothetical protein